jgi:hypothetical protein
MRAHFSSHRGAIVAAALMALCLATGTAVAQNADYAAATNPFQDDFEYEIGTDLRPLVSVDGVRWVRFAIRPKTDREYDPGKQVPIVVEIDILNNGDNADVLLIVLFEDENGNSLDRLELDPIGVGRGRLREDVQKHKITGSVLEATRKLYLFFEVSR